MKPSHFIIAAAAIATIFLSVATSSFAENSPKAVVSMFCKPDFEGHRLGSSAYAPIKPLVMYQAEPGWDTALGIRSYEILNEKIEGDTAEVSVRYDIDRSWPDDIGDVGRYRIATFTLSRMAGVWKIAKPVVFPRVSSKLLCSEYKFCTDIDKQIPLNPPFVKGDLQ